MLLLGLNSFITNVIGLVIKKPKPLMIPSPHSELLIF